MNRRWILLIFIVWIAARLAWYVPWLLGAEQPSPAVLAIIMAVLDIVVLIVVVAYLVRSAVSGASDDGE